MTSGRVTGMTLTEFLRARIAEDEAEATRNLGRAGHSYPAVRVAVYGSIPLSGTAEAGGIDNAIMSAGTPSNPLRYVAMSSGRGDGRVKVHAAGCPDIARQVAVGASVWYLQAATLTEAVREAGEEEADIFGDDGADALPCATRNAT